MGGCGRVICSNTKPGVAVAQHDPFQVPGCHVCGHAGVQQPLGRDAPLRQFAKVDRIDLGHPDIDAAISVAVYNMGAHARLDLQDGPQDVRVHAMALRRGHQALVFSQDGGCLCMGGCLAKDCRVFPKERAQAKGRKLMTVNAHQSG